MIMYKDEDYTKTPQNGKYSISERVRNKPQDWWNSAGNWWNKLNKGLVGYELETSNNPVWKTIKDFHRGTLGADYEANFPDISRWQKDTLDSIKGNINPPRDLNSHPNASHTNLTNQEQYIERLLKNQQELNDAAGVGYSTNKPITPIPDFNNGTGIDATQVKTGVNNLTNANTGIGTTANTGIGTTGTTGTTGINRGATNATSSSGGYRTQDPFLTAGIDKPGTIDYQQSNFWNDYFGSGADAQIKGADGKIRDNPNYISSADGWGGMFGAAQLGLSAYGTFEGLRQGRDEIKIAQGGLDLNRRKYNDAVKYRQDLIAQNQRMTQGNS